MRVIETEERPSMLDRKSEDRPTTCKRQRVKRPLMQERESGKTNDARE